MPISATQFVVRWTNPAPALLPLFQTAGVEALLVAEASAAFVEAAAAAKLPLLHSSEETGLIGAGLWPGVRQSANRVRDIEVVSASREPWVDANSYLVAYHRALDPAKTPVLAYEANEKAGVRPDVEIPYDTAALGLIETRIAGGNFVVDLPPRFKEKLLNGDAKAQAAWAGLGRTAAWLQANASLLGRPALPEITAIVEEGAPTREIANLLHRRGASPSLKSIARVPAPDKKILALVAASLRQVPPAVYAHAEAGAAVVIDSVPPGGAKLIREEIDRVFYSYGAGTIVAYRKRIVDPSEFALDVIDIVTHKRRATRLWNANSAIPLATMGEHPNEAILHIVNYGSPTQEEIQAHIQGRYAKATLHAPGKDPKPLKVAPRGASSEVFVPPIERLAVVRFSN
ncbi:hypothetical protein [Bryobacter aggregatus]|uniref:hypothetical protein n=1 Tax=Bryobacter aggregatus TaxID=360054 RepID=UPI0004E1066C|nr:hypothetical protein [Bryobacter aggregatus]